MSENKRDTEIEELNYFIGLGEKMGRKDFIKFNATGKDIAAFLIEYNLWKSQVSRLINKISEDTVLEPDNVPNNFSRYHLMPEIERSIRISDLEEDIRSAIIKAIGVLKNLKSEKTLDKTLEYNSQKSILYIGQKEIKISGKNQKDVLSVIFKQERPSNTIWHFSEISELIDPIEKPKDKKYYNALYALNKKVNLEAGIKDLFVLKLHTAQFNKDYF